MTPGKFIYLLDPHPLPGLWVAGNDHTGHTWPGQCCAGAGFSWLFLLVVEWEAESRHRTHSHATVRTQTQIWLGWGYGGTTVQVTPSAAAQTPLLGALAPEHRWQVSCCL